MCGGNTIKDAFTVTSGKSGFYASHSVAAAPIPPVPGKEPVNPPLPEVKSKFKHLFDAVFVSSRVAQIISEPYFSDLLRGNQPVNSSATPPQPSVVVVETSKFLLPLSDKEKMLFDSRIVEYATGVATANDANPAQPRPGKKLIQLPTGDSDHPNEFVVPRRYREDNARRAGKKRSEDTRGNPLPAELPDILVFSTTR